MLLLVAVLLAAPHRVYVSDEVSDDVAVIENDALVGDGMRLRGTGSSRKFKTLFQIRNSRYRISSMVWIAPSGRTSPTPTVMIRFRYAYLSVEVSNLGSVRK